MVRLDHDACLAPDWHQYQVESQPSTDGTQFAAINPSPDCPTKRCLEDFLQPRLSGVNVRFDDISRSHAQPVSRSGVEGLFDSRTHYRLRGFDSGWEAIKEVDENSVSKIFIACLHRRALRKCWKGDNAADKYQSDRRTREAGYSGYPPTVILTVNGGRTPVH